MGRTIASVIALLAAIALFSVNPAPSSGTVVHTPVMVAEETPESPVYVDDMPGGLYAYTDGYAAVQCVDFETMGNRECTDADGIALLESAISDVWAESLAPGEALDVTNGSELLSTALLHSGWTSSRTDGCECLYPPNAAAI